MVDLESVWYGPAPDVAPTLVFLHEGLGSASAWRDFPRHLAECTGFGGLVYSRRGYGQSPSADLPRSVQYMHDEAAVLDEVLLHHRVENAILIGHSDGASIALIHAGSPRRVRVHALVLEAPHVFAEPSGIESIRKIGEMYETTDLRARLARHHRDVDNAFHGWRDVWLHPEFLHWNIEEFLASIAVPLLMIQGSGDEYGTWKQIETIERQVRGPVETLRVEGAGHAPHRDQPTLVLDAMAAFITASYR